MNIVTAYIITFVASFCILVIEIVAGRILAPFVGVSLYTWTSIIGVVLAGISIGAYLGGKLADRFPGRKTLGWLLLVSGIATLADLSVNKYCCRLSFSNVTHAADTYRHDNHFFYPELHPRNDFSCSCQTHYP